MKALRLGILILLFVSGWSCRKKEYPPEEVVENSPVFKSEFSIDNQKVLLEAGVNNYYMFSSFHQDTNLVYGFFGELKKADCSGNCPGSLKIQINDNQVSSSNGLSNAPEALKVGLYEYLSGIALPSYKVRFESSYNKTAATYTWNFGDGKGSNEANPIHVYERPGRYNVCLTIKGTDGCISTICNNEKIGMKNVFTTYVTATPSFSNFTHFQAAFTKNGVPPYKYSWNMGDGAVSNLDEIHHLYPLRGSYPVSLMVIDNRNDTAYAGYNFVTAGDLSSCAANYKMTIEEEINTKGLGLSGVAISWTDAGGKVYTSNSPLQPSASSFEILAAADAETNERGEKTRKIKVRFKCMLYHNNTNSVSIDSGEATICVAYK